MEKSSSSDLVLNTNVSKYGFVPILFVELPIDISKLSNNILELCRLQMLKILSHMILSYIKLGLTMKSYKMFLFRHGPIDKVYSETVFSAIKI